MTTASLHIEHPRMPELTLFEATHRSTSAARDERYGLELTGHGISVSRNLSVEDLRSIRDWLDQVIGASEMREAS